MTTTTTSTDQPTAISRPKPPPLEPRCPPCSICGEDTRYEDGFVCEPCGAAWDSENYNHDDGEWIDSGDQCPWALAYWRDSAQYPHLQNIVYRCLLTEAHAGKHQHPDFIGGWDDKAKNAYVVEDAPEAVDCDV